MKIFLNSAYNIVKVEDNKFVANSAAYDNTITYFFVDDSGNIAHNETPSYCGLAVRRADGNKVLNLRAVPIQDSSDNWCWKYSISEDDGVLSVKGGLEISAQFVKAIVSNNVITSRETQGTAVTTAFVLDNIGRADEDWYAAHGAQNQAQHDALQAQITPNTTDIAALKVRMGTAESDVDNLESEVAQNTTDIGTNAADIVDLKATRAFPETPIGQMTGSTTPTDEELTAFTQTSVGRAPRLNDAIIYILTITGVTDKNYKYIYSVNGWDGYEIPAIEVAGNGSNGILQGSYGTGKSYTVLVNIAGGEILNIYAKDTSTNVYRQLSEFLNANKDSITALVNGTTTAGLATKAIQDQNENTINLYYAPVNSVYTKAQSDARYMSQNIGKTYYIVTGGYSETPSSDTSAKYSITAAPDVWNTIFDITRTLEGDYNFSALNTYVNRFWNTFSAAVSNAQLRLSTYIKKAADVGWTLANTELSGAFTPSVSVKEKYDFSDNFADIVGNIDTAVGDLFRQVLEFNYASGAGQPATVGVDLYSDINYPSTFNFEASVTKYDVNYVSGFKSVPLAASAFTLDATTNLYKATITQLQHLQPVADHYMVYLTQQLDADTQTQFMFSPVFHADGSIDIYTETAANCTVEVASAIVSNGGNKSILQIENPTTFPNVDFNIFGAVKVLQTAAASALTLPTPTDGNIAFEIFIANDANSTEIIRVNGIEIAPDGGKGFKWVGSWYNF